MARVSIIIPCYNCEKYVAKAVRSAQFQVKGGYEDFEIIVVDDGSDDGSKEVLSRLPTIWGKKAEVYEIPHSGRAIARNYGFEKSSGEYILFLDADDILHHKYLFHTYDLLDVIPEAHYLYTDFWAWRPPYRRYCYCGETTFEHLKKKMCFGITSLLRASSFAAVGKFNNRLEVAEDHDLFLRLTQLGYPDKPLNYVGMPLWYYRRHTENTNWPTHTPYLRLWWQLVPEHWENRYRHVNWVQFYEKLDMAEVQCTDCPVNGCVMSKKKNIICCLDCPEKDKCEMFNCPVFDHGGLGEEEKK